MLGQLIPCRGGQPIPLSKPRILVGRTKECDFTIPCTTISKKHCLLELLDGVWFVADLGSRNGVRVDGERCKQGQLPPGSTLWVGPHRFLVEYGAQGAPRATPVTAREEVRGREESRTVSDTPAARPRQPASARASTPSSLPAPSRSPATPVASTPAPAAEVLTRPRAPAGSLLGELIPCGGGRSIPLTQESLVVGRSSACDIVIPVSTVSSKHCRLDFQEGFWHVRDLGSSNGIRVDGVYQTAKYLKPGDILWIATLRYEIAYTPRGDEMPPDEKPFSMGLLEKAGLAGKFAAGQNPIRPPPSDEQPSQKRWSLDDSDLS